MRTHASSKAGTRALVRGALVRGLATLSAAVVASACALPGCSSERARAPQAVVGVAPASSASVAIGDERPAPCEVGARLARRADELRLGGRLFRADAALADALRWCLALEPQVRPLREAIAGERSSSDAPAELEARADALAANGDEAGSRRERERALSARETRLGNAAWVSAVHPFPPRNLTWSLDSKLAALIRGVDLSVYDGDLATERERYHLGFGAASVSWFPKRRALLIAGTNDSVHILDLDRKRLGPELAGGAGAVGPLTMATVSPDERYLIVAGHKRLAIFDTASGALAGSVAVPADSWDFAVSPSSSRLAVTDGLGRVRLYELPAVTLASEYWQGDTRATVAFQSDARVVVARSGEVVTVDAATGAAIGPPLLNADCDPLVVGPAAARVVWECYAYLEAEGPAGQPRVPFDTPGTQAHLYTSFERVFASADGSRLWFSLWGHQGLVDTKTGKRLATGPDVDDVGLGAGFRPDNRRVVLVKPHADGFVIWDLKQELRDVTDYESPPSGTLLASPLQGLLLAATADADDAAGPPQMRIELRAGGGEARSVGPVLRATAAPVYAADGSRAGLAYEDRFDVIDLASGETIASLPLDGSARAAALGPRGDVCAIGGRSELRLVAVATGGVLATWPATFAARDRLLVSPGGRRILHIGEGGAKLWEVGRDAPQQLSEKARAAAFAGDDRVVTADAEVVLHDLRDGTRRSLARLKDVSSVAAAADGRAVLVFSRDGVTLVDTADDSLVTLPASELYGAEALFLEHSLLAIHVPSSGEVRLLRAPSGKWLGTLQRLTESSAFYRSRLGNVELFGDAAPQLSCLVAPEVRPFAACAERYLEAGLLARTLAGRGCTAEDVGDVCE